jgi:hypothetical protein
MRRIAVSILLGLAAAAPAAADPGPAVCLADLQHLAARLAAAWAERPVAAGLDQEGRLVSTFASAAGTWTLVLTRPGGPSCVVAAGSGFVLEAEGPGA